MRSYIIGPQGRLILQLFYVSLNFYFQNCLQFSESKVQHSLQSKHFVLPIRRKLDMEVKLENSVLPSPLELHARGNLDENDTLDRPNHLIVLCHGLVGCPEDLRYLEDKLGAEGGSEVLVLNCRSNVGRTKEGVVEGGARVADEIRSIIASHPSLHSISVVGNSLGGLYIRYAIKVLYEPEQGKIAGLQPLTFMTIASPHLGVRRYTWGIQYPKSLFPIAGLLFGQTGRELFLQDSSFDPDKRNLHSSNQPLLMKMALHNEYLDALRAFERRCLYSNLRGDFLVGLRTAAIEPEPIQEPIPVQLAHEWFTGRKKGVIIARQKNVSQNINREIGLTDSQHNHAEAAMAESLNALSWTKIIVDFGACIVPRHHNNICAHSANVWTRFAHKAGRNIMDHAALYLVTKGEDIPLTENMDVADMP